MEALKLSLIFVLSWITVHFLFSIIDFARNTMIAMSIGLRGWSGYRWSLSLWMFFWISSSMNSHNIEGTKLKLKKGDFSSLTCLFFTSSIVDCWCCWSGWKLIVFPWGKCSQQLFPCPLSSSTLNHTPISTENGIYLWVVSW